MTFLEQCRASLATQAMQHAVDAGEDGEGADARYERAISLLLEAALDVQRNRAKAATSTDEAGIRRLAELDIRAAQEADARRRRADELAQLAHAHGLAAALTRFQETTMARYPGWSL
jgi:hypothetical protein